MKFTLVFALLCGLCFCSYAQQPPANAIAMENAAISKQLYSAEPPSITGRIINASEEELKSVELKFSIPSFFQPVQSEKKMKPSADGHFQLKMDYSFPYQQVFLLIGDNFFANVYVNKGVELEIDYNKIRAGKEDQEVTDATKFIGPDAALNIFKQQFWDYKENECSSIREQMDSVFIKQPIIEKALQQYNQQYALLKHIYDEFILANPSPYAWIINNQIEADYYTDLIPKWTQNETGISDSIWQKIRQHKSYIISSSSSLYYHVLSNYLQKSQGAIYTSFTWGEIANLSSLTQYEKSVADSLLLNKNTTGRTAAAQEKINAWAKALQPRIDELVLEKQIISRIPLIDSLFIPTKADILKLKLANTIDIADQQIALRMIIQNIKTAGWAQVMAKKEAEIIEEQLTSYYATINTADKLSGESTIGTPILKTSFGASLYKATNINATDFINALKKQFNGKAVLIDRWATWCMPCIAEMPHSKQLQISSVNLPVSFVYLCTLRSSTEDKWKLKVTEMEQPGIHILIDEKLDQELSEYFSFGGYPGYALLDKNGKHKINAFQWLSQVKNANDLAKLIEAD